MDGTNYALAPDPHTHGHDVGALEAWMSDVNKTMDSSIAKAKREQGRGVGLSPAQSAEQFHAIAEQLADELYAKGKKFTVFHNELARQTAAHCPRVARSVASFVSVGIFVLPKFGGDCTCVCCHWGACIVECWYKCGQGCVLRLRRRLSGMSNR